MIFASTGEAEPTRPVETGAEERVARRLRIAYLCDHDPLDRNLYSGGNARIFEALQRHVGDVYVLGPGWGLAEPVRRLVHRLPDALNLRLRWRLHLALGPLTARAVHAQLRQRPCDILFCAYSVASLHRIVPPRGVLTIFTADATPTVYRRSVIGKRFGSYFALSRLFDPCITRAETRTLRSADLLLWPSNWLRRAATEIHGLDPARSRTVRWGANIETPPREVSPRSIARDAPVEMLFVGRDWIAKGGPMTLRITEQLRSRGVDARLTVIGCTPPGLEADRQRGPAAHVTVHPSLDKSVPSQLARLQAAYRRAHFLVLPSFESYGFAFCEASAYGLPSLCFDAGGVPVWDDLNGHALAPDTPARDFVQIIEDYLTDAPAYEALRRTTRDAFERQLNWDAWGRSVAALVAEHLPVRAPAGQEAGQDDVAAG